MALNREIKFIVSVLACGIMLHLYTYDESRVALMRLEPQLKLDSSFTDTIKQSCPSLLSQNQRAAELMIVGKFTPNSQATESRCLVSVETAHLQRFHLRSHWLYSIQIKTDQGKAVLQRTFSAEFPRPLCLLPFVALLFALLFNLRVWQMRWLLASYLFLLAGGNLIEGFSMFTKSFATTMSSDPSFWGMAFILLWAAFQRSALPVEDLPRVEPGRVQGFFNRVFTQLLGLWSPAVYTAFGRTLFPFRAQASRLLIFFNAQVLVATVSLYLLGVDFQTKHFWENSLSLPRYFAFIIFFFYALYAWKGRTSRQVLFWKIPRLPQATILFLVLEAVSSFFPHLRLLSSTNTLTRLGIALLGGELLPPRAVDIKPFTRLAATGLIAVLVATSIPVLSAQSGLTDLVLAMFDPRLHPNTFILFSFLAAVAVGIVTGSFSVSFFAFFNLLITNSQQPILRAALMDGVLVGSFLSPFSLYNLIPAVEFNFDLKLLLQARFRQLGVPLLMATVVYAVTLPAVSILRPLMFVFVCLVAFTLDLKRNHWIISGSRFWIPPHTDPR